MNTPAHAILNLFLLGRQKTGEKIIPILIGAVLPDLIILALYFWHLLLGTPESVIWSVEYFKPGWQAMIDIFNSMPLLLVGMMECLKKKRKIISLVFKNYNRFANNFTKYTVRHFKDCSCIICDWHTLWLFAWIQWSSISYCYKRSFQNCRSIFFLCEWFLFI